MFNLIRLIVYLSFEIFLSKVIEKPVNSIFELILIEHFGTYVMFDLIISRNGWSIVELQSFVQVLQVPDFRALFLVL